MAAYASTTTLDTPRAARLGGNSPLGVLSGLCNVSNYNQTPTEITAITHHFRTGGILTVVPNGISTNGFIIKWDAATKSFRAYGTAGADITVGSGTITADPPTLDVTSGNPATHPAGFATTGGGIFVSDAAYTIAGGFVAGAITDTRTLATAAGAIAEAASDTDIGSFTFLAIGQLG